MARKFAKHKYLYRTWLEISKSAVAANYKSFRKIIPKAVRIMGVVKSNAYGHELFGFSRNLVKLGANWLGVDSISEGYALREIGIKIPVLVMGYTIPQNLPLAGKSNISVTISQFENLKAMKNSKKTKIHLKIDSGMHRQGFQLKDLGAVTKMLSKKSNVQAEGIYTHFADAKDPKHMEGTLKQMSLFKEAVRIIKKQKPRALVHAAATAGIINAGAAFDMVRVGIGLYGLWPSRETETAFGNSIHLEPVMSWKSIISETKTVAKGEGVGYGFTKILRRRSRLAIVPIGYWHGYPRCLSNKGAVLIRGKQAPVIGNVCMDMISVDVTDIAGAKTGDEVALIGAQGTKKILADQIAEIAGTTNYEIVTRINPLIKRVFID